MFFIGMLLAAAIAALVVWLALIKKVEIKWWEWLLGAGAILFGMMAVQHYTGSIAEFEPSAGTIGALIFAGIAVVLAALTVQFVWRRNRAS